MKKKRNTLKTVLYTVVAAVAFFSVFVSLYLGGFIPFLQYVGVRKVTVCSWEITTSFTAQDLKPFCPDPHKTVKVRNELNIITPSGKFNLDKSSASGNDIACSGVTLGTTLVSRDWWFFTKSGIYTAEFVFMKPDGSSKVVQTKSFSVPSICKLYGAPPEVNPCGNGRCDYGERLNCPRDCEAQPSITPTVVPPSSEPVQPTTTPVTAVTDTKPPLPPFASPTPTPTGDEEEDGEGVTYECPDGRIVSDPTECKAEFTQETWVLIGAIITIIALATIIIFLYLRRRG